MTTDRITNAMSPATALAAGLALIAVGAFLQWDAHRAQGEFGAAGPDYGTLAVSSFATWAGVVIGMIGAVAIAVRIALAGHAQASSDAEAC